MTMMDTVTVALHSPAPLEEMRKVVKSWISEGLTKDQALEQLELIRRTLRNENREQDEDVILEVMDFLTGWCSPHVKLS